MYLAGKKSSPLGIMPQVLLSPCGHFRRGHPPSSFRLLESLYDSVVRISVHPSKVVHQKVVHLPNGCDLPKGCAHDR